MGVGGSRVLDDCCARGRIGEREARGEGRGARGRRLRAGRDDLALIMSRRSSIFLKLNQDMPF